MTVVNLVYGPHNYDIIPSSAALLSHALNDLNNAVAWSAPVEKPGTVTHVGLYVSGIVGAPPNYRVALVGLDTNGRPTTTPHGGSAIAEVALVAGWQWVELPTPATVAIGEYCAVYVWPGTVIPDASNYVSVTRQAIGGRGVTARFTTGYLVETGCTIMAYMYDDSSVVGNALEWNTAYQRIDQSNWIDHANKFTLPVRMKVKGVRVSFATTMGSSTTFTVFLSGIDESNLLTDVAGYEGSTITATVSDKDFVDDANYADIFFPEPIQLQADTTYLVGVYCPSSSAAIYISLPIFRFVSAEAMAWWPPNLGTWHYTFRAHGATGTTPYFDQPTYMLMVSLLISDMDLYTGYPLGAEEYAFIS